MAILVTGGTKGIGLAIALRFSAPGNDVLVNYHRDERAAEEAVAAIGGRGATAHALRHDVTSPQGAASLLEDVADRVDRLDQLVHCAVRVVPGPFLAADPTSVADAISLNGTALYFLTQAALPLLRRGSTVFFLTSRGGRIVVPNYAAVGAGKALGEALMRYLAVELAPHGVRINAVAPATVETDALRAVFGDQTAAVVAEAAAVNPSGRGIEDDDYTAVIEFLASPAAAMVQGQVIYVNGGKGLMA